MPCRQIYMQHCSSRRTCWQRCGMIGMPAMCRCGLNASHLECWNAVAAADPAGSYAAYKHAQAVLMPGNAQT